MKQVNFFDLSLYLTPMGEGLMIQGQAGKDNRGIPRLSRFGFKNLSQRVKVKTLDYSNSTHQEALKGLMNIYTQDVVRNTELLRTKAVNVFKEAIKQHLETVDSDSINFFIVDTPDYLTYFVHKAIIEEFDSYPVYYQFNNGGFVSLICPDYKDFNRLLAKQQLG